MGPLCYGDTGKSLATRLVPRKSMGSDSGRTLALDFKLEDGGEVRIINDDEVIGTILNPDDIVSFT